MIEIMTLGEIMLRLSPPGHQRFIQASQFDVTYGGSEANIAACLASFGHKTGYITKLPCNAIADCVVASLRKSNVDCSTIVRGGKRLGTYFLENGVSVRPSNVVYDRADSAMAESKPEDFDFEESLRGIKWFHTSGITPVIGKETVEVVKKAMQVAKKNGAIVSFDLNYRGKLWTSDIANKQKMISELMEYVDICFGNARDAALVLGYKDGDKDFINGDYSICVNEENMQKVIKKYNFKYLVSSLRNSISASDNEYSAVVSTDSDYYVGKNYMVHIVDRVGSGDAFASGFIHGIITGMTKEDALNFAISSAVIKHTIPGDFNYTSVEEVAKLANGDSSGRVQR
ncbi:2-dehydro-3-deoxygluconokinase [Fusobacterium sp. DD29]|uniref:sugar kinase n=1 Tax=unclassified Fusobacterium TaxID=2648384 RepID=UPI001B8B89F0|nr:MULTISPECIES: sugar kinase [unclassified Fusobacterium]MBR8749506.1 2-dehydro-3-deoxygluconokinase [Fusobacterium sp. DD29]MBR8761767.1 2-dehydro-3-deoxygluconokinase [Fusobacterium sp. DD25]MBR8767785.1 2-dehydro-3-deoxygluconokinase [Fusobacterium sp. DD43]MBR8771794.1 2-dehydro-3-deoxygluconokinase [Fusobacterium sp. DD40]MBR8776061.1 2-dehydro-3-deoxygluconokinase [Fusobacterium sp. DD17]